VRSVLRVGPRNDMLRIEREVGRGRPTYQERKTNPIGPGRPGMGAAWRAAMPSRRAIVRNEPNFPCRRRLTEEIVQNEPNFPRPRAGAGGEMRRTNPISAPAGHPEGGKNALRRHYKRRNSCETNPISPAAGVCRRQNAQNEPNSSRRGAGDGGNCAKRSQTWGGWGMWAKSVVVWGVARPGRETCKTNPIWSGRGADAGNKTRETNPIPKGRPVGRIPIIPLFHHSTIPMRRWSCKTKPNLGQLGYAGKGSYRVGHGSAGE
jgi:hypothetical protein